MCVMCRPCLTTSKQPPCQSINASSLFSPYPLPPFLLLLQGWHWASYIAGGGAGPGPIGNPATAVKGTSKKEGRALTAGWSIYLVRDIIPSGAPDFMRLPGQQGRTKTFETQRHTAQPATGDGTCWLARLVCAGPSCVGMGNTTVLRTQHFYFVVVSCPSAHPVFYSRFAGAATRLCLI